MKKKAKATGMLTVRSASHQELLLSGKYGRRVEKDRTKYLRHTKHRYSDKESGVFVCVNRLSNTVSVLMNAVFLRISSFHRGDQTAVVDLHISLR